MLTIGGANELKAEAGAQVSELLTALRPWKKGPLSIFGAHATAHISPPLLENGC